MAARLSPEQKTDRAMTERTLQDRVLYRARKYGWKTAHAGRGFTPDGMMLTPMSPGWPDLVLAKANRPLIFVELKRELGKPTSEQLEWLQLLNLTGNFAVIWRPSDLREGRIKLILQMEERFADG